ncbi:MAG: methyl-accepting chemotaxis protein, partial [Treponema sp.]|nr:methyl-accepting chemotaxis protein [Treponema sp.]
MENIVRKGRKNSLAAKITAVCLTITVLTSLTLFVVFVSQSRSIIRQQAATNTRDNIAALRDQLLERFGNWEALVRFTAAGAVPFITPDHVDAGELQSLFIRNVAIQPDVNILYATSNTLWTGAGGFAVFHNSWNPPAAWDNTERPWFLAAKANPGQGSIGYTNPFLDAMTETLIISVVTNIYDDLGRDVGVISVDVGLAFLASMLGEKTIWPEHKIFLINGEGLFITHPESSSILTHDFFDVFALARYRDDVLSRPYFSSHSMGTFIHSELIPGIDWILVSILPDSAIFSETNLFVARMAFIAAALLIMAMLILVLFVYKKLTVPIRRIKGIAGQLADMDFAVGIKITGNDEIGEMQRAMLRIRDNLKKGIDDMNAHLSTALEKSDKLNDVVVESFTVMEGMAESINIVDGNVGSQKESMRIAAGSVD